jgi:hypothetical protein
MYGEFKFSHGNYDIEWNAGELTIIESYDDTHMGTVKVSMNDLRDIYKKADGLYSSFELSPGDRVVLSDTALVNGGMLPKRYRNIIGVVEEVLTEWEESDPICWDFHVKFGNNLYLTGVHWGDVRKI